MGKEVYNLEGVITMSEFSDEYKEFNSESLENIKLEKALKLIENSRKVIVESSYDIYEFYKIIGDTYYYISSMKARRYGLIEKNNAIYFMYKKDIWNIDAVNKAENREYLNDVIDYKLKALYCYIKSMDGILEDTNEILKYIQEAEDINIEDSDGLKKLAMEMNSEEILGFIHMNFFTDMNEYNKKIEILNKEGYPYNIFADLMINNMLYITNIYTRSVICDELAILYDYIKDAENSFKFASDAVMHQSFYSLIIMLKYYCQNNDFVEAEKYYNLINKYEILNEIDCAIKIEIKQKANAMYYNFFKNNKKYNEIEMLSAEIKKENEKNLRLLNEELNKYEQNKNVKEYIENVIEKLDKYDL